MKTLITTYKATGRTVGNYAAPILTPQLSRIEWNSIQRQQKNHRMPHHVTSKSYSCRNQNHSYRKTDPSSILLSQYILKRPHELHPCHRIVTEANPARNIRESSASKLNHTITSFLNTIEPDPRRFTIMD